MRIPLISTWTQPDRPVSRAAFLMLAAGVIISDQLTKWLAVKYLMPRQADPSLPLDVTKVDVIPGCFGLLYRENTGAAFSLFEHHTFLLALFSMAISLVFVLWAWRIKPQERGFRIAFGLIVGGALGNLIDRLRLDYVIDFIHWYWRDHIWPTFNIADSAVCVGMVLLFIASLRLPREITSSNGDEPPPGSQQTPPNASGKVV